MNTIKKFISCNENVQIFTRGSHSWKYSCFHYTQWQNLWYSQPKSQYPLFILQQITGRKRATLSGAVLTSFWHFAGVSLRFHNVRRCNFVLSRVNNVRNICKRQRYSQNCWRDFFILWRKVGRIWRIQLLLRRFLCVRTEADQHLCVICWVINHSFLVSFKKINHSRSALVIWSTWQLTSKQWFITQKITARGDLCLNFTASELKAKFRANKTG